MNPLLLQIVTNVTDTASFVSAMNAWASQSQYVDAYFEGLTYSLPFWAVVMGFSVVRSIVGDKQQEDI